MSLVIVGLSHHSAPLPVVERAIGGSDRLTQLRADLAAAADINEFMVLETCNRIEVLADAERFHGAVRDIADALADGTDIARLDLTEYLYVHYDDRAVHHLFELTCGLSSMALGEPHVLGQVRAAFIGAQRDGSLGPRLNPVLQHALRVGKQARTQTSLDVVARSLVQIGVDALVALVPLPARPRPRVLIVGSGAMGGLAAGTIARQGAADVQVVGRDLGRATALAQRHGALASDWADLPALIGRCDLVICCTGSADPVISAELVSTARRGRSEHPVGFLDLALPVDVELGVGDLPGVHLLGLAQIQSTARNHTPAAHVQAVLDEVADLITSEVAAYLLSRRVHEVAPTVAALRGRAATVVQAELDRLDHRLPELDEHSRAQLQQTVARIVDKLLHTPTVRAKEMGARSEPGDYARVLQELFDLDPEQTLSVHAPADLGPGDAV